MREFPQPLDGGNGADSHQETRRSLREIADSSIIRPFRSREPRVVLERNEYIGMFRNDAGDCGIAISLGQVVPPLAGITNVLDSRRLPQREPHSRALDALAQLRRISKLADQTLKFSLTLPRCLYQRLSVGDFGRTRVERSMVLPPKCKATMESPEALAVSVDEAARRLSLSPRTVATLIAIRELRSIKIGRRRLVPMKALQDFLRRDHSSAPATGDADQ